MLGTKVSNLDVNTVLCRLFLHCLISASPCGYTLADTSKGSGNNGLQPESISTAHNPSSEHTRSLTRHSMSKQASARLRRSSLSASLLRSPKPHCYMQFWWWSCKVQRFPTPCHHIQHFLPGPIAEGLNGLQPCTDTQGRPSDYATARPTTYRYILQPDDNYHDRVYHLAFPP